MSEKKWIKIYLTSFSFFYLIIGLLNYIIDPYGIYNTTYFNFHKITQISKDRLVKSIKSKDSLYSSFVIGTSRACAAYNPEHKYFKKQSYNFSMSSASMYEVHLLVDNILRNNSIKTILLVIDYIQFHSKKQKRIKEMEEYFSNNKYVYLFSLSTFQDTIKTLFWKKNKSYYSVYKKNGQEQKINHTVRFRGNYLSLFKRDESEYYKNYSTNYTYKDTGNKSFDDFDKIIKACYENNIRLDIIFGPSHIRQWEALNYYLGYEKWLKWKKDVVLEVDKIARLHKKAPFKVYDFATYNEFTSEKIPTEKGLEMKWHFENSHYKETLGNKVLNVLLGSEKYDNFGIELNTSNIDRHLNNQRKNRLKYIDIKKYKEDLGKYLKTKL